MNPVDTLAELMRPSPSNLRLRVGTVTAIANPKVTVRIAGSDVSGVSRLSFYAPVVGDVVLIAQTEAGLLVVLGRTA